MSDLNETVAIRPSRWRRWRRPVVLPLLAVCLLFGAAMLLWRERYQVHELILLGCFSVGALVLLVQSVLLFGESRRLPAVTLELSPCGLTTYFLPGQGTIPWPDLEAFGYVRDEWAGQTAGLRLRSYDGFLSSRAVPFDPPLEALRETRGFEVMVPRLALDCSVEEFFDLLDEYVERFGGQSVPG